MEENRYCPPVCPGLRTNRITLRLTDSEADWLSDAAWESRMSQAEFVRGRVFSSEVPQVPPEVKDLFHELFYHVGKIGNNINQIARNANASGYVSATSFRRAADGLDDLNETCRRFYEAVMEVYEDGNHKTDPHQRKTAR